jgi:hypothetical protein
VPTVGNPQRRSNRSVAELRSGLRRTKNDGTCRDRIRALHPVVNANCGDACGCRLLVVQFRWPSLPPTFFCGRADIIQHAGAVGYKRAMPLPQAGHPLDAHRAADPRSRVLQLQSRSPSPSCVERCKELTEVCSTDKDFEISPSSLPNTSAQTRTPIPASIAPWETARNNSDFTNYRRDLSALDGFGSKIPSINRQPPSSSTPTVPWGNGNVMPTSVFNNFYDDPSEDIGQHSPGFRPGSSQEDMTGYIEDDRRPSIASATTISSTGSKSSVGRGFHKRLHHFFGEELPSDGRQGSDTSLPPFAMYSTTSTADSRPTQTLPRNRTNSTNNSTFAPTISRPGSPSSFARPRTPHTSEVTPWEFQDYKVRKTWSNDRK